MLKWNELYSLDSLLIAATQNYTKCLFQKYKSYTLDVNDSTLYDWARHNKANLIRLHNQLRSNVFAFQPFSKKVLKLGSKVRDIYIPTWRDRIVDGMLNVELNRHTNDLQSQHSYAYRLKNSGVDICQTRIARKLFEYDCPVYIIKRDISNYYPSISKPILLDKIAQYVDKNDYLYRLIKSRIYYSAMRGDAVCADSGIPFGSPLSCFLANLYLNDLDFIIQKRNVNYFRYADDILIFGSDRNEMIAAGQDLDAELNKLQLTCKPSHTKNVCFYGPGDEVFKKAVSLKHLGLYFKDTRLIGIAREKQRKILNIFKRVIQRRMGGVNKLKTPEARARFIIGLINKAITDNIKPTAVIDYYLKHMTDLDQIKLMDRLVAELVLSIATGKGYKKSNWKVLPYKQLREMGLPSLLHRHRLLNHGKISSNFFDFRVRKKSKVDVKAMKDSSYQETL